MNEILLTVKGVAELKNCSERYIQKLIEKGNISAETVSLDIQSPGRGGVQYRIPLEAIDRNLQLKYKRLQQKKEKEAYPVEMDAPEPNPGFDSEDLTGAERAEIALWSGLIKEWRSYRNSAKSLSKEQADEEFITEWNGKSDLKISRTTLYRKWREFNAKGEAALVDRRGKHGNYVRKLVPEMWDIFEHFYLDESQKSIKLCMTLTELELEKTKSELLPLPSADTFGRAVKKIPIPYIEYFRHGEKSFIGKCAPYIKRIYDNLEPNDIWVADNHTFDIMLYDGEKTLRLYLTAFMDVRTRKMMGWCVTDSPSSDATIYALKNGAEKNGLPKMIYTDNGREFLFHDFGGSGFRKKKVTDEEFKPPTILKQLGIEFRTALPRNARAKGIERAFLTVKESFSKLFEAYTGGNVLEKPERLKKVVKRTDKLKRVDEFIGFVDTYLAGGYNKHPHTGDGMNGMSPDDAFAELLIEKRVLTKEQSNLMFMRWSNLLSVGKNGVTLTFYGEKLQYSNDYLWENYFGKKVYVRYKPDDLREVRIYDMDEKFICTATLDEGLEYNASKEAVAEKQREKRTAVKAVKNYKKLKAIEAHDELKLMLDKYSNNLSEDDRKINAVIKPFFGGEELKKAVGSELEDPIDWNAGLEWLKNKKKNETD